MVMSDREIYNRWLNNGKDHKQCVILSQLNACTVDTIKKIINKFESESKKDLVDDKKEENKEHIEPLSKPADVIELRAKFSSKPINMAEKKFNKPKKEQSAVKNSNDVKARRTRWSEDNIKLIADCIKEGLNCKDTAEKLGYDYATGSSFYQTYYKVKKRLNDGTPLIKVREQNKPIASRKDEIKSCVEQGLSCKETAQKMNLDYKVGNALYKQYYNEKTDAKDSNQLPKSSVELRRERIAECIKKGLNCRQTAKELGVEHKVGSVVYKEYYKIKDEIKRSLRVSDESHNVVANNNEDKSFKEDKSNDISYVGATSQLLGEPVVLPKLSNLSKTKSDLHSSIKDDIESVKLRIKYKKKELELLNNILCYYENLDKELSKEV